ncbi:conserved Plasmodium protein, unknown function [Plasmodium gallinaceum]|uniref:Uncharacterized protein n=1 Tax=Plasmodium gallinaceum TaxID=5849 RepID=A0A1J1GZK4_PLAGA|nr:conserved Plasmodium protein, unknown function [Plasmodium gallinaceum]CRG98038.1 conserved Plasmodium protein, unknown function [Plasmodium gallinaceum]
MAYHLFKKLQKSNSKENKINNENKNEDIEKWLKYVHDLNNKDVVDSLLNESNKDNIIIIDECKTYTNNILMYTEKIKNIKNDFDNENSSISYIKQFCKILNIINVYEKLKSNKKKFEILTKNNILNLFEEIILNCLEILNKIICLNKDMFHKKSLKIDCNKLKTYINKLNILFKETNNCDLLFSIFSFENNNSIFILYDLILLLQKIYIYDNINFYFYLYDNIFYSNNINSYFFNLYSLKCFQILYHDYYSESQLNLKEQNNFVQKIYDHYLLIINNLRKNKFLYINYLNFPFNYSDENLTYKNKNENYYINENEEFFSITTKKKFRSYLFYEDDIIKKNLKKLEYYKKIDMLKTAYNSQSSLPSNENTCNEIISKHKKKIQKDKIDKSNINIYNSDHSSNSNKKKSEFNQNKEDILKNQKLTNSEIQINSTSDEDKYENYNYFSSDISSNFISIDEDFDEEKKKKKIKFCEENIFLIMFRSNKIKNIRSNIDKLILHKNNFICKLLSIIDSNKDAYLINEIILLFLLISENNIEIKNIITYERVIETIIKIIREEHYYLFKEIPDLQFLFEDINLEILDRTKIFNISNKLKKKKKIEKYINNGKRETQNYELHPFERRCKVNPLLDNSKKKKNEHQNIEKKNYYINKESNINSNVYQNGETVIEEGENNKKREPEMDYEDEGEKEEEKRENEEKRYISFTDEENLNNDYILNFMKKETSNNENINKVEIYLDNISLNIDIKSSLLLLKCLIINSEFGLKYIYELNIFHEFIKLINNLYNIIIYIYKESLYKFYNNTIFFINIFLDIIFSVCRFNNKNNYDISLNKFSPIFLRGQFIQCSFFFFFKFTFIYLHKMMLYNKKKMKKINMSNENLQNINYSNKNYNNTYESLDEMEKKQNNNNKNNNDGSNNVFLEYDNIIEVFKNTNFINIFNICCKLIFYDENCGVNFLFSSFINDNNKNEGNLLNKNNYLDIHIEENNFIIASFKKQNYFYIENVVTFYLKKLKEVKYIDLLLILFFYDKKNDIIQKNIYEFLMCLCEKYMAISNFINDVFFFKKTCFYYCIMYNINKLKKKILIIKKCYSKKKRYNKDITVHKYHKFIRKENFFLKYFTQLEFLLKVFSLASINSESDENNMIKKILKNYEIDFEEIIYYNSLYIDSYKKKSKYYLKKLNNNITKHILTFKLNLILYRNKINEKICGLKLLFQMLNFKCISKKVKCLICVYISIYLYKKKDDEFKKKLIKIIIEKDIFNIIYYFLNDFCKYAFDKKYFNFSFTNGKNLNENIKNILDIRRKKYFFYYSNEKNIFFIHYIYSNFIHHKILTYFFKQSKNQLYKKSSLKDETSINKKGLFVDNEYKKKNAQKKKRTSQKKLTIENNKYINYKNDKRKEKGKKDELNEVKGEDENKEKQKNEIKEENESVNRYKEEEEEFGNINEEKEEEKENNQQKYERKKLESREIKDEKKKNKKGKKEKKKKNHYVNKADKKKLLSANINEDISLLRHKMEKQEMKHIEEKIYLNNIIEKKNDIINNILYSYLLLKEKTDKTEKENANLKSILSLKEKEYCIMSNNDMNDLKNKYINLLKDYEEINNKKENLDDKLEKLTDLLIFLYDNVSECRLYMQNVENIKSFKNKKSSDDEKHKIEMKGNNLTNDKINEKMDSYADEKICNEINSILYNKVDNHIINQTSNQSDEQIIIQEDNQINN